MHLPLVAQPPLPAPLSMALDADGTTWGPAIAEPCSALWHTSNNACTPAHSIDPDTGNRQATGAISIQPSFLLHGGSLKGLCRCSHQRGAAATAATCCTPCKGRNTIRELLSHHCAACNASAAHRIAAEHSAACTYASTASPQPPKVSGLPHTLGP